MNDSTKSLTARRVVLSGFFFLTGICFASWASRIPDIKMQLGLSDGAFGGILFFLPIGSFVGIPISGSLTAKQGSKVMVIIASIIYEEGDADGFLLSLMNKILDHNPQGRQSR